MSLDMKKKMMLISVLLIFFLSIAMVSASEISTDDSISSDADLVVVDMASDDSESIGLNDQSSDVVDETTSDGDSLLAGDAGESPIAIDEDTGDGESEKKNSILEPYDIQPATDDFAYVDLCLYDEDMVAINGSIDVSFNNQITTVNINGDIQYKFENLQYGLNNVSLIYNGSELYNPCRVDFGIFRADERAFFNVYCQNVLDGEDVTVTLMLVDYDDNLIAEDFNVSICRYEGNSEVFVKSYNCTGGEGTILIPSSELLAGKLYEVHPFFAGNSHYTCAYGYGEFKVIGHDVTINAPNEVYYVYGPKNYYFDLINSADNPIDGMVDIYLNGMFFKTVNLEDGGYLYLDNINSGLNTIAIVYNGTDFYNPATATANITAYLLESYISCNLPLSTNVLSGDVITINASLLDADLGEIINEDITVTLYLVEGYNDYSFVANYTIPNGDGVYLLNTSLLSPGDYIIDVHFDGSELAAPSKYRIFDEMDWDYYCPHFSLYEKRPAKITYDYFHHSVSRPSVGISYALYDGWVEIQTGERVYLIGENISVYLNGDLYDHFVTDSDDNYITIEGLKFGRNHIELVYEGCENYSGDECDIDVFYYTNYYRFTLVDYDYEMAYGEDFSFDITLVDENGEAVEETFTVSLYTDDGYYDSDDKIPLYQTVVNKTGHIVFDSGLFSRSRNYIILAKYNGSGEISPTSILNYLYVYDNRERTHISLDVNDMGLGEDLVTQICLYDDFYNTIDGQINVSIYMDDDYYGELIYKATLNANQEITVDSSLFKVGSYSIYASFEGNDSYIRSSDSAYFSVSSKKSTHISIIAPDIDFRDDAHINVTLLDSKGNMIDTVLYVEILTEEQYWNGEYGEASIPVNSGEILTIPASRFKYPDSTYYVLAEFGGDDEYESTSKLSSFYVGEATKEIVSLVIDAPKTPLGEDVTVTVSVYDEVGELVSGNLEIAFYNTSGESPIYTTTASSGTPCTVDSTYFPEGRYIVTASYAGNEEYYSQTKNASFYVSNREPTILFIEAFDIFVGNDLNIYAGLYDYIEGMDIYDQVVSIAVYTEEEYKSGGDPFYTNTVNSGNSITLDSSLLESGIYYIVGEFAGNEEYMGTHNTEYCNVSEDNRGNLNINVINYSPVVGMRSVTLILSLTDDEGNPCAEYIDLFINEEYGDSLYIEGEGKAIVPLEDGLNTIEFKYFGNNYLPSSKVINMTLVSQPVPIEIELSADKKDIEPGETVDIKINASSSYGTVEGLLVKLFINDDEVALQDLSYPYPFSQDNGGTFNIIAKFEGNYVYAPANSSVLTINVKGKDVNITVSSDKDRIKFGEEAVVTAVANETIDSAELDVYVDGVKVSTIALGDSYTFTGDSLGEHTVYFVFNGNEEYNPFTTDAVAISVYMDTQVGIDASDILEGQVAVIKLNVTDSNGALLDKSISLNIVGLDEGNPFELNASATDSLNVPGLMVGSYKITANFTGDVEYASSAAEFVFNVKPAIANATIEVDVDKNIVTATLKDLDGNPIANAVINALVNGEESNITTDDRGIATLSIDSNSTITVSYTDSNGLSVSDKIKVFYVGESKVRKATQIIYSDMTTTAVDLDTDGRIGEYFRVVLKDADGNILVGKPVQIGFNGKIYNRTTDENGSCQLQINLVRSDIYTFAVAFLGDDDYNGTFVVAKITVNAQKGSLTVPSKSYTASAKTKSLTATFKAASGKVVANKKVTFTVNGKTYSAVTNAKGVATVNVSLNKKGTYSFTAKFAGDGTYAAMSKTGKLTIK